MGRSETVSVDRDEKLNKMEIKILEFGGCLSEVDRTNGATNKQVGFVV